MISSLGKIIIYFLAVPTVSIETWNYASVLVLLFKEEESFIFFIVYTLYQILYIIFFSTD